MSKVFFISAGQLEVKKGKNIKNTKNMYLNYGALLLATIINKAGYDISLIHGHFKLPEDFINELIENGLLESNYPIFISIPSFYAINWVKKLAKLLKEKTDNKICVGGRWVVANSQELLKKELMYVDFVIEGFGENKILTYLTGQKDTNNYKNIPLNYSLLYNREIFQPSIEISRGCPMKCHFCQEKNTELTEIKPTSDIVSEYKKILLNDNLNTMTCILSAHFFLQTVNG